MKILPAGFLAWLLLLAAACAAADTADTAAPQAPFDEPFSLRLKIISRGDWAGLSELGKTGLTEYVVKPVKGMWPGAYRTFDNSYVFAVNTGGMAPATLDTVRDLVRAQVQAAGFKLVDPGKSRAGIACFLSTFRSYSGRATTELLVVVFDREKMRARMRAEPGLRVIDAILQSGVRAMVSHRYPQTVVDLKPEAPDNTTRDTLKILFQRAFDHFMEPTSVEQAAQAEHNHNN